MDRAPRLGFLALAAIAIAVFAKAAGSPPYAMVIAALFSAAALLAALAWVQGPNTNPFAGPLALKIGILAITIFLQPSLIGRDPHFEVAVTERLVEQGTWTPGLDFGSHKARGYSHYPGLSLVASSLSLLFGVEPAGLARLLPPVLSLISLMLVVAIAREVLEDDQRAAWVGIAWACLWMTNVFQAEFVHEALGFPLFLGGIWLVFRQSSTRSWTPALLFALLAAALVLTHHLTTAFLLVFLVLFALSHVALNLTGQRTWTGTGSVLVPASALLGMTVVYYTTVGDTGVLSNFDSIKETIGGFLESSPSEAQPSPSPDGGSAPSSESSPIDTNPQVRQAVFYERRGRDALVFDGRIAFSVVLILASLVNLAWHTFDGSLDARWGSLLAWTGFVFSIGLVVYVANVTVGLDAPRLLPWAFTFLLVTAADVPGRGEAGQRIRERLGDRLPEARVQLAVVVALLVGFAGFQLVTMPTHLVSEEEDPAFYRGQVRIYYHESEQAMTHWVGQELNDGTRIIGDQTTRELVGPIEAGEASAISAHVYSGEALPREESYVLWREEMSNIYRGTDHHMNPAFFPVKQEVKRTFDETPQFAKVYANSRTGVYAYQP